ncbi:hypothetical Protein YC6258_04752 [Gynuella sunshinyii YC6258]|uniref:Uncharacterized protein n=1 Tax=Gynuella sunshinyii YC6258 TaxID=1445510 RepID=A0A0C5W296_9GAMM|nr:hypothetical Protein YC6258_04752 [Gynuella sunshinyii YC6258]
MRKPAATIFRKRQGAAEYGTMLSRLSIIGTSGCIQINYNRPVHRIKQKPAR